MLNFLKKMDIAVDLGTTKIAVFVKGEGLVIEESACIAFKGTVNNPGSIIAFGNEATAMIGKMPQGTTIIRPIRDGVISNCSLTSKLLRMLFKKYRIGVRSVRHPRMLVGTLFGASGAERRSFENVALGAGASKVTLVPEPLAAAVGAGLPIQEPSANMVIDVGGGATEALVISLKDIVAGGSIRIGGDSMTEAIIQFLHRAGLDIGHHEANRIKELAIASLSPNDCLEVKGYDAALRRPCLTQIRIGDLQSALEISFSAIIDMVRNVIEHLPAELAADLIECGITLTGGGAVIGALRKRLKESAQIEVTTIPNPQQAVIMGCGQMLDYLDYFDYAI